MTTTTTRGRLHLLVLAPVFAAFPLAYAASAVSPSQQTAVLRSPNGRLEARFAIERAPAQTGDGGALTYSLSRDGKALILKSGLSLELTGGAPLGTAVDLVSATPGAGVDDYSMIAAKASHVHDRYNSQRLLLKEPQAPGREFVVEARAYDGAFAFRYLIPKQDALPQDLNDLDDLHLAQEDTQFRIAKDASLWALRLPDYRSYYEGDYALLPISGLRNPDGGRHELVGLPLLMHLDGVAWMAITEADLEDNTSMYLVNPSATGDQHWMLSRLAPEADYPALAEDGTLPHRSAWRVILTGDEPGRLIESNVVTDLNPPSRIADTSWIRPGKSSWDWWSGDLGPNGKRAFNMETMEYYVDFAAQSGFPYMMVDAGWSATGDISKMWPRSDIAKFRKQAAEDNASSATNVIGYVDIPGLVQYAAKKGVKIWIWIPYRPAEAQMHRAFPIYEKWGVAGVKIDVIGRDDEQGIRFYYDAAKEAAADHLLLDFHGATKPWGISRTYPNVLGYEAIAGMEQSKAGARDNPTHRATTPFTRMLAGPMDYTPGGFDNVTATEFVPRMVRPMVMGTRAQQLALYVVYLDPIQMVSDTPAAYAGQPAFEFIRDVPVEWDETRALNGYPGKFITIARRSGPDWYLGAITNWTPRDFDLPLDFLGSGRYKTEIYEDGPGAAQNPKDVSIQTREVRDTDHLHLHLAPGGGCAIRFHRESN